MNHSQSHPQTSQFGGGTASMSVRARRALFESSATTTSTTGANSSGRNNNHHQQEDNHRESIVRPAVVGMPSSSSSSSSAVVLNDGDGAVGGGGTNTTSPNKRKPLSFLSPNFKKRSSSHPHPIISSKKGPIISNNNGGDDNSVSRLQNEILELQYRIVRTFGATTGTANDDEGAAADQRNQELLVDLVTEKVLDQTKNSSLLKSAMVYHHHSQQQPEDEAAADEQQQQHVKELNKKLLHIQTGLIEIEGERCQLVARAGQLEREKRQLAAELGNREKEIAALQKRLATAAPVVGSSAHSGGEDKSAAAAANRQKQQLSGLVVELKSELDAVRENGAAAQVQEMELKIKLKQSQAAREELVERLQSVQRDHDGVCESLVRCLASVEKLTSEKMEWEGEKRCLQQHHELQLEQQRLDHIQATADLREELRAREKKVNDLDRLLQGKVASIQRLRKQLSNLEASQADTIKQVVTEYERKVQDIKDELNEKLANEVERELQCANHPFLGLDENSIVQDEMVELQAKLLEKSAEIEALRNDVSTHMQELMAATSELQKLQEDSKMLDSLFQDVETLEHERYSLTETLHEKDTEIAELSAEILKLEIEKELAGQDSLKVQALKTKLEAAEQENESFELRRQEVEKACERLEDEIRSINAGNDETVARIRTAYDAAICDMQLKLQRAEMASQTDRLIHSEALTAKDKTIACMGEQMAAIKADYQSELSSLRAEMQRATTELAMKQDDFLRDLQVSELSDKDEAISSLRKEISILTSESHANEIKAAAAIESLEGQVQQLKAKSLDLEDRATERAMDYQTEVMTMSQNLAALRMENEALQSKILAQRRCLDESESKGKRSGVKADTKIDQLEDQVRQLQSTATDLENRTTASSRDHAMEVESLTRTIAELESVNESSRIAIDQKEQTLQQARVQLKNQQLAFDSELECLDKIIQQHKSRVEDLEADATARTLEQSADALRMKPIISVLQSDVEFLQAANADQQKKLEAATLQLNESDSVNDERVASLTEQIRQLQSRSKELEIEAAAESRSYQAAIDKLTQTVSNLKREHEFSKISLVGAERRLDEEKSKRASLSKQFESLVASERDLREECRLLRLSTEEAQSERNKLAVAMEQEFSCRQSRQQEAVRDELIAVERKLMSHEQQMVLLEEALQDRTKLLTDMVAHNKDLQAQIDRGDSDYKAMEERSSVLQVRVLDREEELQRLRSEWQQKEDEYLGVIHGERNRRELSEAGLAAASLRLETLRVESRDLSELEKENQSLKDKIRRQEAYLQRKIEQEKAVRDRIIPGSVTKAPASAMKTPARLSKGSVRKPASAHASRATRSTVPEHESLDMELDSLLAD